MWRVVVVEKPCRECTQRGLFQALISVNLVTTFAPLRSSGTYDHILLLLYSSLMYSLGLNEVSCYGMELTQNTLYSSI